MIDQLVFLITATPRCGPPPVLDHGSYKPLQESYDHLESVFYFCDDEYVLDKEQLVCVRSSLENGTVAGRWRTPYPTCQVKLWFEYSTGQNFCLV